MSSLIGTLAFSNDAQPFVPADCLRQPLNSNVREGLNKSLFRAKFYVRRFVLALYWWKPHQFGIFGFV